MFAKFMKNVQVGFVKFSRKKSSETKKKCEKHKIKIDKNSFFKKLLFWPLSIINVKFSVLSDDWIDGSGEAGLDMDTGVLGNAYSSF